MKNKVKLNRNIKIGSYQIGFIICAQREKTSFFFLANFATLREHIRI